MKTSHITRSFAVALVAGTTLAPATATAQQDLRMPDTREAAARAKQDLRLPDTRDAAGGRGTENAPIVEFVEVPVAEPQGFDWTDAGLGALAGVGVMLAGAGGAVATVRLRRRPAQA